MDFLNRGASEREARYITICTCLSAKGGGVVVGGGGRDSAG